MLRSEGLVDGPATATATATVAMESAELPVKRTRVGKPKVKTGCTTCKIRRIKCDEARPHCKRCISTGRRCDGYVVPEEKPSSPPHGQGPLVLAFSSTPWNQLLNYPGTRLEHRYFVFFQRHTAPVLSGYFDSHFWNGLLLQFGHAEPTIQHAMMAVASVHEQVERTSSQLLDVGQQDHEMSERRYFALQQYNKAISCLSQRLLKGSQSEEVTLMCCVLFICLEFLRGNIDAAISHLHSGLEILGAWRARSRKLLPDEVLPINSEPHSVPDNLVQMFSRLSIQSMLCGNDPPSANSLASAIDLASTTPVVFRSLQSARTSLDFLMKISLQFLRKARDPRFRAGPNTRAQLDNLSKTLSRWSLAFDLYLVNSSATRTPQDTRAATILRILNVVARIWLSSYESDDECVFDKQTRPFSAIVNLAETMSPDCSTTDMCTESLIAAGNQTERPRGFSFEMGIIPPLYFVAMKCRVPSIRRRAISLLDTTMPRREGIWIASLYVAISKRLIEIEEEDLQTLGNKDETTGELVPPEWRRVRDAKVHSWFEESLKERVQKVTLLMKLDGPCGQYHERDENIRW